VGNPYAFPVAVDTIGNNNLLEPPVYYDGREYKYNVDVLYPWEGYFVYNTSNSPVTISIPPVEAKNTNLPKTSSIVAIDTENEYLLQLSVKMSDTKLIDTQNYIGLLKNAATGRDTLDFTEAPPIGDYVQLSIIENKQRFAGNFKPRQNKGQEWELELRSSVHIGKNIEITIDETGILPENSKLYFLDKDNNCSISTDSKTFNVQLNKHVPVRHFKIIVGTEDYAQQHNEEISLVPISYQLEQNYPNPFNPETTIQYQLARRGHVALEIYNMLGQKIYTLVNEIQNTGQHSVIWDGINDTGSRIASGIYFYQMKTGEFSATKKLLLIR